MGSKVKVCLDLECSVFSDQTYHEVVDLRRLLF